MAFSPYIELMIRRVYWKNIIFFQNQSAKKAAKSSVGISSANTQIDFNKIAEFLKQCGAKPEGLLLVHSAFAPFLGGGKSAGQIVDFLMDLVGVDGTLAMPAMPKFKNSIQAKEYLTADLSEQIFHYDVNKSKVKSGVLPMMLHKRAASIRSRHPINTMVAMGPLAQQLVMDNLKGDSPLACGIHSSWNACVNNDALIVGLGLDLTHSLTTIHVAEDVLDDKWPVSDWYIEKTFKITDGDYQEVRTLRERSPKWGTLHYAERTLAKHLIEAGILKTIQISGLTIEAIKAKELISFLNSRNQSGYPYFWWKK